MTHCTRSRYGVAAVLLSSAALVLAPTPAWAAGADWRPIYDIVMMWVNFVILTAVLVKVLRKPLSRYLREQRDAVEETMAHLDSEKERIEAQIRSLQQDLEDRKQSAS